MTLGRNVAVDQLDTAHRCGVAPAETGVHKAAAATGSAIPSIPNNRHMEPLRRSFVEFEVECSTTNFRWRDL